MAGVFNQVATYWGPSTLNRYNEQSFVSPIQIMVRWEDKSVLFRDKQVGKDVISSAVVYTQSNVSLNGYLFLGTSESGDPKSVDGAYLIRSVGDMVSLKADRTIKKVML